MKRSYILRSGMIIITSLVALLLSLAAGSAWAQPARTFPVPPSVSGGHGTVDPVSQIIVSNPILSVTPPEGLDASGNQGGPFSPASKSYSVSNAGSGELSWTVSVDQPWVTVSPTSGINSGTVTVSINSNANSLPGSPGGALYTATVTFSSKGGSTTRQVRLTVYKPALSVLPPEDLNASGNQGGPFSPASKSYSVSNAGSGDLSWTVSVDQPWVTVSPASGINSGTVTVSINSNANSLPGSPGGALYTATVTFSSNGGSTVRHVTLTVNRAVAYITNADEDTVSVIDMLANSVLSEIHVGQKPLGVAANTQSMIVYVTNYDSNTVSVIDAETNEVTATITVGSNPVGIAVDKVGSTLYVVNYKGNSLSVIDTATNEVVATVKVGTNPCGVAVSPDGSTAYVTDYRSRTVSVIKKVSSAFELIAKIKVGTGPYGIAVHPSGSTVYVANYAAGTVSVIDAATLTAVGKVNVGGRPTGVALNPEGTLAYVTKNDSAIVSVIDTTTHKVVRTVEVGRGPFGVATDGTRIFVANSGDNNISIIDTGDFGIEATVPVGRRPMAFGDFVISGEGGVSVVLQQSLKPIPAQERENQSHKKKVRPLSDPPHVE